MEFKVIQNIFLEENQKLGLKGDKLMQMAESKEITRSEFRLMLIMIEKQSDMLMQLFNKVEAAYQEELNSKH